MAQNWRHCFEHTWRHVSERPDPDPRGQPPVIQALNPVIAALEELGVRYHVGGSVASSLHGLPRSTNDVDVVAELVPGQLGQFISWVENAYYVDLQAAREAVHKRTSFNLIHEETAVKIDIFVSEGGPFDQQEMDRAQIKVSDAVPARPFFVKS